MAGDFFRVLVRPLNVSISCKVQHQIFQNERHITTDISKNTFKTLDFLSNVIEMKFKSKKLPENRQSPEAIHMQSDMSHMRTFFVPPGGTSYQSFTVYYNCRQWFSLLYLYALCFNSI